MISPLSTLAESLRVKPAENGQVAVTVVLPPELVHDYCRFLESLTGFFQSANRLSRHAAALGRIHPPDVLEAAQRHVADYRKRLVSAFDRYEAQGLPRKEIVKRIAADLRAEQHPWRSPDLVRSELVAAGRGGRAGRPSRERRGAA